LAQVADPCGRQSSLFAGGDTNDVIHGRRHSRSAMLAAIVSGLLSGVGSYTELVEWWHD
jgi:hypothetical protein